MSRGEDIATKQKKLNQMKAQMHNDLERYFDVHSKLKNGEMKINDYKSYATKTFNALRNRFLAVSNYYGFDEKGKYLFNATNILKENTALSNFEICKILINEVNSLSLETKERINKTSFLQKLGLLNNENEMTR